MAVIVLPATPQVEEFFNRNHSHADGRFTSGGGSGGGHSKTSYPKAGTQGGKNRATTSGKRTGKDGDAVDIVTRARYVASLHDRGTGKVSYPKGGTQGGKHKATATGRRASSDADAVGLFDRGKTARAARSAQESKAPAHKAPAAPAKSSSAPKVVANKIVVDGKPVTRKITKVGSTYVATLVGKQHSTTSPHTGVTRQREVYAQTKTQLAANVAKYIAGDKSVGA